MFYAHIVLAKKGPLARIWLAAHWDKKITKAHVFETNIEQSVDGIMQPKVKLALRTSGHLLLGVVRIYARKAKYLLADCNEAFVKIKMAFRPGMVDLPEEHREAAVNAITLPEVFHDFDTPLPELNDVDIEAHFSINQSRADEITMREDYGTLPMNIHDDGFGDMGFDDTPDIVRDRIDEPMEDDPSTMTGPEDERGGGTTLLAGGGERGAGSVSPEVASSGATPDDSAKEKPPDTKQGLRPRAKSLYEELAEQPPQDTRWNEYLDDLFTDPVAPPPDLEQEKEPLPGTSRTSVLDSFDPHHPHAVDNDGFGDEGFGAEPAAGLFEGDIFADAPLAPEPELPAAPAQTQEDSDDDDDDHFDVGGAPSPAPSSDNSRPPSPIMTQQLLDDLQQPGTSQDAAVAPKDVADQEAAVDVPVPMVTDDEQPEQQPPVGEKRPAEVEEEHHVPEEDAREEDANVDQTTLLQNEEESFALAPVDASALKGVTKSKRKRKLIVDEVKNISGEEMKSQLANTSDIVTTLDLAPPTKRLMYWKETGGVEKLFALPSRDIPARCMFKNYQRHLTSRSIGVEDFPVLGPLDVLGVEQQPERPESPIQEKRRGRKRKVQTQEFLPPDTPATPMMPMTPATPAHLDQSSVDQMREAVEMPPPTPVSMELREQDMCADGSQSFHPDGSMMPPPATPGLANIGSPMGMHTPQMMPPTPGMPSIPMTPGNLEHGGLTPAGLPHGGLTPGDLQHGGLTPAGLHHGGLTPAGLAHGGMTPAGLAHGGMTPGGLVHGGMTPAGLAHGGMTPAGLTHGGMTPAGLQHGDSGHVMADLPGAMTPHGLDHGGMTPHHASLENIDQIPNLPADQVSSILNEPGMENFSNMGYDGHPASPARGVLADDVQNDWNHDYEFPQSVGGHQPTDDMQVDETIEQFEERVLNKRAAQLFVSVRSRLLKTDTMVLSDMTHRNNKKQAAQKFYSLLVLKKFKALEITQTQPYADITISRGPLFENPKL